MSNKQDAQKMWEALNGANRARAGVYVEFFRTLEKYFGRETAIQITKEAVYNWGRTLATGLEKHVPRDFQGLCSSFAYSPDGGAMFAPHVFSCSDEGLDVKFENCPLKEAWVEAGMPDDEVSLFCEMAARADYGTLEAAGFAVDIETWLPGKTGCCRLKIKPA